MKNQTKKMWKFRVSQSAWLEYSEPLTEDEAFARASRLGALEFAPAEIVKEVKLK